MKTIVSIFLFLGGIALIFWAVKPLWKEISTLRVERSNVLSTLSELRNLQDAKDKLLAAYNSISKNDLEKLNQVLPQSSDTGDILVSLEKMTQDRGMRLKKIEFKTDENKNTNVPVANATIQESLKSNQMFNDVNLSLVVSASYDVFKSFLNALEKNSRVIDVTNISFSVGQTDLYEFTLQADAYYGKNVEKVTNLREIGGIKIDTSFFSDPKFGKLELTPASLGTTTETKKGRTNPFLPI